MASATLALPVVMVANAHVVSAAWVPFLCRRSTLVLLGGTHPVWPVLSSSDPRTAACTVLWLARSGLAWLFGYCTIKVFSGAVEDSQVGYCRVTMVLGRLPEVSARGSGGRF